MRWILALPAFLTAAFGQSTPMAAEATARLGLGMLSQAQGNTVFSPFSAQSALVMAYAGAAGETRWQMAQALGLGKSSIEEYSQLLSGLTEKSPENVELSVVARLFGQTGYPFIPKFLELLSSCFRAPLEEVDFEAAPGAAAQRINSWVAEQTRDRIRDLVPEDAVSRSTGLLLVNAIYFRAPWAEPFAEGATRPGFFHPENGDALEVPFMRKTGMLGYQRGENFTAVGIPYLGQNFLFVAVLPDGPLAEFEKSLDAPLLLSFSQMPFRQVDVQLPRFRIEPPRMSLSDYLKKLGMKAAFDLPKGSADFSEMAERRPKEYLYISDVFHKAFIEVNESGTEAAAATAVVMMRVTSLPQEATEIVLNRPFLFAVFHRPTSNLLFLGRLANPQN